MTSDEVDEDWEEWDGRSPFWAHCAAGSLAGVVEHAAIYPLDTVRTHIQVCAACVHRTNLFGVNVSGTNNRAVSAPPTSTMYEGAALHRNNSSIPGSRVSHVGSPSPTPAPTSAMPQHRLPLGMWQTIRFLMNEPVIATEAIEGSTLVQQQQRASIGSTTSTTATNLTAGWTRLFRGVHTILFGCIPAHALYFSSYEFVKSYHLDEHGQVTAFGSSLAGAAAVTSHDLIMTPLDTLKQRLQIGHYSGAWQAARAIYKHEGIHALYRSFPITLFANIPYGMIMVSTHEACKAALRESWAPDRPQWQVVLAASSVAGLVASAVTTPLDRIKTSLQTQQLTPVCAALQAPCPLTQNLTPKHRNWEQAAIAIWREEGMIGFFRGVAPRILSHTPAVAISWTTYETAKHYLLAHH